MELCNLCEGRRRYSVKKFEDGEMVVVKDTGENVTINRCSYSPRRNGYTYYVKENPGFFYLEDDFEKVSGSDSTE